MFAAVGPFGVGLLHDATGTWTAALWLLVATGFGLGAAGILAASPWSLEQHLGQPQESAKPVPKGGTRALSLTTRSDHHV